MKRLLKTCRCLVSDGTGSALIELALSVPVFMMLFTGAASFSVALFKLQQIGNATTVVAQQLGAQAGTLTDPCSTTATTVTSSLPGWTSASFMYKLTLTDKDGTAHSYTSTAGQSFSCTAGATYMAANKPVTVQVTYAYTWMPIFKFIRVGNLSATQTALME
jgi:Flp pilus assembly protein TadG